MIYILTFFMIVLVWRSLVAITHKDSQKLSFWKGLYLLLGFLFVILTPTLWISSWLLSNGVDSVYSVITASLVGVILLVAVVKTTNKGTET